MKPVGRTLAIRRAAGTGGFFANDNEAARSCWYHVPDSPEVGQVEDLMPIGPSMGGARPKAVVEDANGLWLAKFNRGDDKWNHARVEHSMLRLASACGVQTAQSRIVHVADRDVLLVKRFDREKSSHGYLRARMMSSLTILRTEDTHRPSAPPTWTVRTASRGRG